MVTRPVQRGAARTGERLRRGHLEGRGRTPDHDARRPGGSFRRGLHGDIDVPLRTASTPAGWTDDADPCGRELTATSWLGGGVPGRPVS